MSRQLRDMTEPEIGAYMGNMAELIDSITPEGSGFMLIVFDDPGVAQYVGNRRREDMIRAMRETADRLERKEDIRR